jgi:2-phosphosulfolactate phosphatase
MFHLINAADGCAFARAHGAVVIVVDTLRASTTMAILLERAREVIVVRSVKDARALAAEQPGSLLAGERDGLPPEGFDLGNSPVAARHFDCAGRPVIFTSTTGAARAVAMVGS